VIDFSSSFEVDPGDVDFSATAMGPDTPMFYARWQNPTVQECEIALADLEGAEAALCFASGMAAISGVLLHSLSAGDHVILPEICYAGVAEFGHDTLPRLGIDVDRVDMSDLDAVAKAMRANTKLVHVETPCNPTLALTDIKAIARIAHAGGAKLSVDATVASPISTRACDFGADYAIHSLTKYISGHGDVLGGVVSGAASLIGDLRKDVGVHLGASMHPMAAWLTMRSLTTLSARLALHEKNALAVAQHLQNHPAVGRVNYPGLEDHPQHDLAKAQMSNFSGLLSFSIKGDPAQVLDRIASAKHIKHAISLGKPQTLVFYLPTDALQSNAFRLSPEGLDRLKSIAGEGVLRLSVGLEPVSEIITDLEMLLDPA